MVGQTAGDLLDPDIRDAVVKQQLTGSLCTGHAALIAHLTVFSELRLDMNLRRQ
jgi:hypothetical protein